MFLSLDRPGSGQQAHAATGTWLFLRQLEAALQADAPLRDIAGAVLNLFVSAVQGASGWAGYPAANGAWSLWSASFNHADEFSRHGAAAWLPNDPDGLIADAWNAGESRVSGTVAVVMLRGQFMVHGVILLAASGGGSQFPASWSTEMLGHFGRLIGQALDTRERQAAMQRGQILYQTLLRGADAVMQARSETTLLRRLCAELMDSGLFSSVRIGGLADDGTYRWLVLRGAIPPRRLRRHLARGASRVIDGTVHDSVSAIAWRTGTPAIANDFINDPRFTLWHAQARALGWRALAAVPVARGGRPWAVLTLDSATPDIFDDDLKILLQRLAGMVGHALDELDLKRALGARRDGLTKTARRDSLTGLPNRFGLQVHLRGHLARTRRRRGQLGIGVLDLDDFRQINNRFGNAGGDAVLRAIGGRLRQALRDVDFVARLGGDEFALVLNDWNESNAAGFCARIGAATGGGIALPCGNSVTIGFTLGFTLFPLDDAEPDILLRHADAALHLAKAAKAAGGPAWKLYHGLDQQVAADTGGNANIRRLLHQNALVVHYQPVIDIQTGRPRVVEALARLNDGDKLLPPGLFLPNMMLQDRNELFHQVLRAGLAQLRTWDAEGNPLSLSVNVDSQILLLEDTLSFIDEALTCQGIPPQRLILEILETHEFLDLEKARIHLTAVRERGIRIALDDLGMGYSSILKLRDLPIDVVKLDRAFTAGLRQRPDDLAFISAFQMLTRTLGMMLVIEGVETGDIMDALRMMGEGLAQGYGIARPMAGEQLSTWMRAYVPVTASSVPATLLGAYAVHLNWVRMFQVERVRGEMLAYLRQQNPYSLESFFRNDPDGAEPAAAHRDLQRLLRLETSDRAAIDAAAARFRDALVTGLAAGA